MSGLHRRTHPQPVDGCFGCRVMTLHIGGLAFQPGWNWSVGRYIASERDLKDALKECGDRNSVATGTHHEYEMRHPSDIQPFSEADQVIDDRARNLRAIADGQPLPMRRSDHDPAPAA